VPSLFASGPFAVNPGEAVLYAYSGMGYLHVKIPKRFRRAFLDPALASGATPVELAAGAPLVVALNAAVSAPAAGLAPFTLRPPAVFAISSPPPRPRLYGVPRLADVLAALEQQGHGNVDINHEGPSSVILTIPSLGGARLRLEPYASHIQAGDDLARLVLRDLLLRSTK
jgi:hypothetical protein